MVQEFLRFVAGFGRRDDEAGVRAENRDLRAQNRALQTRLQLLTKVSALAGNLHYEQVLGGIAELAVPEIADMCVVDIVEGQDFRRAHWAHDDPALAPVLTQLMQFKPGWRRLPQWPQLLAGRSVLIAEVTPEILRHYSQSADHLALLRRLGIYSSLTVPLWVGKTSVAILGFTTTKFSGRRLGPEDLPLAEELTRRAAQLVENARLHEELQKSESRFRVALATVNTAVFEQDLDLRYRWSYYARTSDTVGKTDSDLMPVSDAERLSALKRQVIASGEPVREEVELTINGERCFFREAIDPLRDVSGRIIGVIGAATDITSEKRTQEQLQQALAFRERMIGVLGHDLRNPLNAVSMAAALLRQRGDLREDVRVRVEQMERAAERMKAIISTLFDFTQARFRGGLPISPVATDLADLSRPVIEELRATHPELRIELSVRGDSRGDWDPVRMGQVVSNLVGNALTHGDPRRGVEVTIDGVRSRGEVWLRVTNRGPIIPPEMIPVLFEPFRRGADNASPAGLGLGLYIVQQIVLAHGGSIAVDSTREHGTRFEVRLPRTRPAAGPPADATAPPPSPA